MAERGRTHRKWVNTNADAIIQAAAQAMKLWENLEAVDHTVFLVYLHVEEHVESDRERKIMFLRSIETAESVPTATVHTMYDYICASSVKEGSVSAHDALEHVLAHRPGLLRIAVIDECPFNTRDPFFKSIPVQLEETSLDGARSDMLADGDWLKLLKKRIDWVENAWKQPIRRAAYLHWIDKNQEHILCAGIHALKLQKQPNRIDTDIFLVAVDSREEVVSSVWRSTKFFFSVGKACAIPADIVNKKYPDPAATDVAATTAVPLKIGEQLLRILVVDDMGVADSNAKMPVNTHISPITHTLPQRIVLPLFEPGWLSQFKKNARS
ncbi:hypothetical protein FIBSPDRAFT_62699 [Athelia psychrophila]|uniref:Uncharacterized protein n=1 Tax=Athelia psychrophila TaxID=1759441 RepID=A0A166F2R8_9AGAM|nr:hypothetical protein FIBSPDRAFT_62699 [Fibularhizoctonia sp. CBS 109695]